jgi:predicted ATP-grasp superfamily ATP-dependent carboligase
MPAPVVSDVQERLDALVRASGVLGLNGLDFLLDGERWSALELNPRPTATMELYDPDYQHGLFHQHIEACRGSLPSAAVTPRAARAQAIVHAPAAWAVTPLFAFPEWCADIPVPGTLLAPGDPACTVHAEAPTPDRAVAMVEERRDEMERTLAVEAARTVGG